MFVWPQVVVLALRPSPPIGQFKIGSPWLRSTAQTQIPAPRRESEVKQKKKNVLFAVDEEKELLFSKFKRKMVIK